MEIVIVKGFGSGLGALCVALLLGERLPAALPLLGAMLLGFVAYGLSILLYLYAQRGLGAARTSAYYALAPFLVRRCPFFCFVTPFPPALRWRWR